MIITCHFCISRIQGHDRFKHNCFDCVFGRWVGGGGGALHITHKIAQSPYGPTRDFFSLHFNMLSFTDITITVQ